MRPHNSLDTPSLRLLDATDVFVELFERGRIANEANADLFVSVHCNSHSSQASGTETFVLGLNRNETNFEVAKKENSVIYLEDNYEVTYAGYDPNSAESTIGLTIMQEEYLDQSILLADLVQKEFTHTLKRKNRGVKQMGLIVLHQTYMPSVTVVDLMISSEKEWVKMGGCLMKIPLREMKTKMKVPGTTIKFRGIFG